MLRTVFVVIGYWLFLSACTQKVVCPAYQSAFIYDQDELRKKFSYFKEDSTPKLASVNKTKYLIAEPVSYKKKTQSLKTVEAKPLIPVVPDSLLMGDSAAIAAELDEAARSVIDSTYIADTDSAAADSAAQKEYVISVDREVRVLKYNKPDTVAFDEATGTYRAQKPSYYIKNVGFNVEEGNYLWYLRDVLILPDVRLAKKQEAEKGKEEAKKKKGIKGFFSNLFKKKKKQQSTDEVPDQQVSPDLDEYNFDGFDDNRTEAPPQQESQPEKKKKGLGGIFKKNKKSEPQPAKEKATKKEDEGDGF